MIEAPHYSATGTKKKAVVLPALLFDGTVNEHALHRAVVTLLANQRQGTHDTKTRRWVVGGNQKPWRQKGTGRARQGSTRAPHWRHGGIVFGPHPRDYRLGIPKKVRQLAKKSALNARGARRPCSWSIRSSTRSRRPRPWPSCSGSWGSRTRKYWCSRPARRARTTSTSRGGTSPTST